MLQAWSSTTVSLIFFKFSSEIWVIPSLRDYPDSPRPQQWVCSPAAGWTPRTYAAPESLYARFPVGAGICQSSMGFFIYGHQNLHHVASLSRSPFQTCFLCCWMESLPCFPITMDLKHLQVYSFYCPGLLCGPPECLSWLKHSFQAV